MIMEKISTSINIEFFSFRRIIDFCKPIVDHTRYMLQVF